MKDYQVMIYMSLGTLLASEIKGLIDHMNPFNLKFCHYEKDEKDEKDEKKPILKEIYTVPDYTLGKNSPTPRWCANSHD